MSLSQGALTLGRVAGIRIVVHRAWLPFALVLTAVLAHVTTPGLFPAWTTGQRWLLAALLVGGETVAGLLHELSHSLVAVAHRRQVHSITLYGFAAATRRAASPAGSHEEALIALAGPLSHFVVAGVCWGLYLGVLADAPIASIAAVLLSLCNLAVGVVNLLPVAPLDGGRAVLALVRGRSGMRFARERIGAPNACAPATACGCSTCWWPRTATARPTAPSRCSSAPPRASSNKSRWSEAARSIRSWPAARRGRRVAAWASGRRQSDRPAP
jgi:Zn-dependent protease